LEANLARLIDEAYAGLAHLDADGLERLALRAEALQKCSMQPLAGRRTRLLLLLQRLRLLSALLKSTEENLDTLRRADALERDERLPATAGVGAYSYTPPSGLVAASGRCGEAAAFDCLAWEWPRKQRARPS
jgi:hypothetical protein